MPRIALLQHLVSGCPRACSQRLLLAVALACGAFACSSADLSVSAPSTAKCQVSVTDSPGMLPAAGGSGSLSVTTTRDCTWEATSATPWLVLTGPASGQGSGDLSYRANPNVDPSTRRANLTVNDTTVAIAQEAAPCRFTITPSSTSVVAVGGSAVVRVDTASALCSWTAASQTQWVHVSSSSQ